MLVIFGGFLTGEFFVVYTYAVIRIVIWASLLNFTSCWKIIWNDSGCVVKNWKWLCSYVKIRLCKKPPYLTYWYLYWLSYWKILLSRIRCFPNNLFYGEPYSSFRYLVFFANLHLPSRLKRFFSSCLHTHGWCLLSM